MSRREKHGSIFFISAIVLWCIGVYLIVGWSGVCILAGLFFFILANKVFQQAQEEKEAKMRIEAAANKDDFENYIFQRGAKREESERA
jgi:hypothetical protein